MNEDIMDINVDNVGTEFTQAITITYGDVAENHIGNEQLGIEAEEGLSYDFLREIYDYYTSEKYIEDTKSSRGNVSFSCENVVLPSSK